MVEITPETTIADIVPTLSNPTEYVRRVLGNMAACKKNYGTALVRIVTTGRGIVPHYRVEPKMALELFGDDERWAAHFTAYHGRSHQKLPWGLGELRGHHWSDGEMTFEEVQTLLGQLRSVAPKRKADT